MVVSVHSNVEKDRGRLTPTPFRPLRPKLPRTRRRCGCGPINRFPMSLAKKVGMYRNIYYYHKWSWLGMCFQCFLGKGENKTYDFHRCSTRMASMKIQSADLLTKCFDLEAIGGVTPLTNWRPTWCHLDGLGRTWKFIALSKVDSVTFWISPSLVVSITVFGRLRIS